MASNNNRLRDGVAARRGALQSRKINGLSCPTDATPPFENKGKYPALSNGKSPYSISNRMNPKHKRMSRTLGYCLAIGSEEAWAGFRFVALACLEEVEAAQLAYFTLSSLHPENIEKVSRLAIGSAGSPAPAFLGGMEDARTWAAWASRQELKAYALAAFEAMTPRDQAAFFQHISNVEIAA